MELEKHCKASDIRVPCRSRESDKGMRSWIIITLVVSVSIFACLPCIAASSSEEDYSKMSPAKAAFMKDYLFTWGEKAVEDDGTAILSIVNKDKKGGGWTSRQPWIHGEFSSMIKLPTGPSCGVVSAFYLTSEWNMSWPNDLHDEIDFEMLGDDNTGEILLQTNYFVGGVGGHEERFKLWFDPTLDFHEYKFQVNKEAVRWFVDGILVREITAFTEGGLPRTSMFLVASIWDGAWWVPCTLGREERKLDYDSAPFNLYFKNVTMQSCYWRQQATKVPPPCANPNHIYGWDGKPHHKANKVLKHLQDHYMVYNWKTWNTSGSPVKIEAPEERTAAEMFDLSTDESLIRGRVKPQVLDDDTTD